MLPPPGWAICRTACCSLPPKTKAMDSTHLYLKTTQVCLLAQTFPLFLPQFLLLHLTETNKSCYPDTLRQCITGCIARSCSRSIHAEVWVDQYAGVACLFTPSFPLSSLFFRVFHNVGLFSARIRVYNLLVLNSLSYLQAWSGVCRDV